MSAHPSFTTACDGAVLVALAEDFACVAAQDGTISCAGRNDFA
jgi:hypothetical protein